MTCAICKHGETQPGETTLTLTRDALMLVVKRVPARVCDNCGETYVDEATTARLLQAAGRQPARACRSRCASMLWRDRAQASIDSG